MNHRTNNELGISVKTSDRGGYIRVMDSVGIEIRSFTDLENAKSFEEGAIYGYKLHKHEIRKGLHPSPKKSKVNYAFNIAGRILLLILALSGTALLISNLVGYGGLETANPFWLSGISLFFWLVFACSNTETLD